MLEAYSSSANARRGREGLVFIGAFAVIVGMLGGSSRFDVVQLTALRPMSALFLAGTLYFMARAQMDEAKPLFALLALFALWMALQLVPMPSSVWQTLPDRDLIANLDRAAGLSESWRPVSLTPIRGFNALFSLAVPAAALMLAAVVGARSRYLLQVVASLGVVDALLSLLQVVSGRGSPLFTYAITNDGSAVGLFANENHSAVFSAICLLTIARLGANSKFCKEPVWLRIAYAPAFALVLLSIFASGSRAGIAMGLLALLVSFFLFAMAINGKGKPDRGALTLQAWIVKHPRTILGAFAVTIGLLIATFVFLGRMPGFESLASQDPLLDLRWKLLPLIGEMIGKHWLIGTGFGSFDRLYMVYEPTELLMPAYVNQAHNDWAQLVIEGGVPAVLLCLAILVWTARSIGIVVLKGQSGIADLLFWGAIFAIVAAASLVDYPLRTPLFQVVSIWLFWALANESTELQHNRR